MKIEKGSLKHMQLKSIQGKISVIMQKHVSENEAMSLLLYACDKDKSVLASILTNKK